LKRSIVLSDITDMTGFQSVTRPCHPPPCRKLKSTKYVECVLRSEKVCLSVHRHVLVFSYHGTAYLPLSSL